LIVLLIERGDNDEDESGNDGEIDDMKFDLSTCFGVGFSG
jgi:hypothetical protein